MKRRPVGELGEVGDLAAQEFSSVPGENAAETFSFEADIARSNASNRPADQLAGNRVMRAKYNWPTR